MSEEFNFSKRSQTGSSSGKTNSQFGGTTPSGRNKSAAFMLKKILLFLLPLLIGAAVLFISFHRRKTVSTKREIELHQ